MLHAAGDARIPNAQPTTDQDRSWKAVGCVLVACWPFWGMLDAIGRNWAGVHYYSDYSESFRLGEQVALGLLEEQKLTYGENFFLTVPLLDGTSVRI